MNRKILYLFACFILFACFASPVFGINLHDKQQGQHASHSIHQIGFDFRPEYILPTNPFIKGDNARQQPVRRAFSTHLRYGFQFSPSSALGRLYPYAYQGIGLSYTAFDNARELGRPVAVYAFQGSRIAGVGSKLSVDYEWGFGASFGWKHYDPVTNPYNEVVGSSINAFLNLGILLHWRFLPGWLATAGIDITHYSNGSTHYPNAGINMIAGRVGISRIINADASMSGSDASRSRKAHAFRRHFSYDLILFAAPKQKGLYWQGKAYLASGQYGVLGLNFTPLYNVNRYFRGGVSLDMKYDESSNIAQHVADTSTEDHLQFYRPPLKEQITVGLSVRGELVLPIFSVNAGIGTNVYAKTPDGRGLYQVLALKASFTRNLFLHVGYQMHRFRDPDNLMLGLGVRFNAARI